MLDLLLISADVRRSAFHLRRDKNWGMQATTLPQSDTFTPRPLFVLPSMRYVCAKRTYPSKRDAETARNLALSRDNRPHYLRIYPCSYCHGWHLTHKPDHDVLSVEHTPRIRRKEAMSVSANRRAYSSV